MKNTPEQLEADRGQSLPRRLLGTAVLLVLVGFAFQYLRRHATELEQIEWHWASLVPLVLTEATLLIVRGLLTRVLCGPFSVRLGVIEAATLAAWTSLANYLTPMVGGTGVRALYLKRRHDLPYAALASVQAATYMLHFAIAAAVGLACLTALADIASGPRLGLIVFFVIVLAAVLLVRRWPFGNLGLRGRAGRFVNRALSAWHEIQGTNLAPVVGLLLVNLGLQALALRLSFALLGVALPPVQALFIAALSVFAILLAITPAALGITEGIVVFAAALVHVPTALALSAAAVRRVLTIATVALVAGFGYLRASDGRG